MAGYDRSRFVSLPDGIEEELTCGICLNIMNNPMSTPCCRNSYCKQCILQSLQFASNPNTCPNDRQILLSKDLIPAPRMVTNILDKQEVYCDFKPYGCPKTVKLGELSNHLIQCGFDPKKESEKCNRLLKNLSESIDKLKSYLKKHDLNVIKKQISDCQREVKLLSSNTMAKTVMVEAHSSAFQKDVIDSAKKNIEKGEVVTTNIESSSLKKEVMKRCKEAIRQSDDYNQIGQYLVDTLNNYNNSDYEWNVFVFPKMSAHNSISNFVVKMHINFGQLSILMTAHYPQDEDEYDDGDHYLDYSEDLADADYDDDDDDDDEWEDWRPHLGQ